MNDISEAFNCCIQCQGFWDCKVRLENVEKGRETLCCGSCTNFELCKIVKDKLKEKSSKAAR